MAIVTPYLSEFDHAAPICIRRWPLAARQRKRAARREGAGLLSSFRIQREDFSEYRRDHFLEFRRVFGGREMTAGEDDAFGVLDLFGGALRHFGGAGEIVFAGEKEDRQLPRYFRN